jgi:hypothetical protein
VPEYQPIKTKLGILRSRDALHLSNLEFKPLEKILILSGVLDARHSSSHLEQDLQFSLRFFSVVALEVTDLDSFHGDLSSSFDVVLNSSWFENAGGNVMAGHKHYQIIERHHILGIIADGFKLELR